MNAKLKFIHTADIHLGRPLSYAGSPSQELLDIFNKAGEDALQNLVEKSIKNKVDFIIIAGDLYDLEARSVKSSRFFLEQCKKLKKENIPIYIISGNHDPAGKKREPFALPDNVHFFSSENAETKLFSKNGFKTARIIGQSYREKFESRSMYNYFTASDDGIFNIGILHTSLDRESSRYVPVSKSDLMSKEEIHYWALGHIHQQQLINKKNPIINYPGTIQGRDINETGRKGCSLVEVDKNMNIKIKFEALSPVIFKNIEIKLEPEDKVKNLSDLEKIMLKKGKKILSELLNDYEEHLFEGVIARWIISGRSKVNKFIQNNREEVEERLKEEIEINFADQRPFIWPHSIVLRTGDELPELKELQKNSELFKEIALLFQDLKEDQELQAELLSEWGKIWEGNPESEDREVDRFFADENLKDEILKEVEKIIISEIIEGGDQQ
jgi:DNA repair exonuclease SbcCD nuclease subunit